MEAGGYFEGLLRKHVLENPHRLTLVSRPAEAEREKACRGGGELADRRSAAPRAASSGGGDPRSVCSTELGRSSAL